VDADGCPKAIKEILFRVANRTMITTTLVANQTLQIPPSRYIKMLRVNSGYDVADNEIVKQLSVGDLVITGDIPLANDVVEKGGHAINPRGELYTRENIKERLNMRDFMDMLRGSGIHTGGVAPQNAHDIQAFANQLDKFLTQVKNYTGTSA
ncbi:MAG: YaiI/YqxD family protein, partial [Methylococcales bacterium]|nr:YaiI/YqxD family protein [Methylococcales bacterium]